MSNAIPRRSYQPLGGVVDSDQSQRVDFMVEALSDLTEEQIDSLSAALDEEERGMARPFDMEDAARTHGLELSEMKKRIQ